MWCVFIVVIVTWTNLVYGLSTENIKLESERESRGRGGILEKLILKCSARNEDPFFCAVTFLCCPRKGGKHGGLCAWEKTREHTRRVHAPQAIFSRSKLDSYWSEQHQWLYPSHAKYVCSGYIWADVNRKWFSNYLIAINFLFLHVQCQSFSHVGSNHLLELCRRLGPLVDKEVPTNVRGIHSLLGAGRQSILRRKEGKVYYNLYLTVPHV